ncbi:MAG: DegT/DnrJ/EryC1/StrS aminotransferase family protein [Deltaproteobacteria bacterium]|nr:DegT/DnrJ/EryC1/StrS aminotransferase family protein [Deltaproteobacteria bacterium]MBW2724744.1 DegT/DnrJ/EryC1/StrS aminotransferase family protein [Deltaproteobacteria bacterium]
MRESRAAAVHPRLRRTEVSEVPFVDLAAQYRRLKPQIDARIQAVLGHGQFIMGPEVTELEAALGKFAGCEHAIAVSSGTDALSMALMVEGIGPGHAVLVPAFTFPATAEAIVLAGARPVFVDVDARTFNIDTEHLSAQIETVKRDGRLEARAIMPVDLFGLPADHAEIGKIAAEHDMLVIADGAQSFGGRVGDVRVGALAPITTTSFFPAKPLGCFGDGGAIFTNDSERAEVLRSIRTHGESRANNEILRIGMNGRLDTLQAAILLAKLAAFPEELEAREQLATHYDSRLSEAVTVPMRQEGKSSAWAQYSILLEDRDRVAAALREAGIPSAVYYSTPLHLQPAYAEFGDGNASLPVSESLSLRILSLPMHPDMEGASADRICDSLLEAIP